jgi:hypothetical protein
MTSRKKAEERFAERNAKRAAKRKARQLVSGAWPAEGASVARDRPRRSPLERARSQQYAHYVSQPSEEEERVEARASLLRGTEIVFPAY